jgi:hypothetical protein
MGFVLNPYDLCVANKTINGKQCTIVWYVDDNKISHVDHNVVTEIIAKIEIRFGKVTVTRGKEHIFLGMKITLRADKTVKINMEDYVKEAIVDSLEDVSVGATTPAHKNLFDINPESTPLDKVKAERFHSIVAKLLYISKRGRPDVLLAVAFLCTRVSCSTDEDWRKLKRLSQYLNRTVDDFVILGADTLSALRTWVDAAYGVHNDMKSHTGGVISLGGGVVMCKSSKQKLNTKSSTEAELVGASDYLPSKIWAKFFLEAQGHQITTNVFEQDNQSAIKLEQNGRKSCGQKSRHIDIRFFFTTDRIRNDNITIAYCPTEQMLADFLTKPLQGALFQKFKRVMMGYVHINTLSDPPLVPIEERVEDPVSRNQETEEETIVTKSERRNDEETIKIDRDPNKDSDTDEGWTTITKRTKKVCFVSEPLEMVRSRKNENTCTSTRSAASTSTRANGTSTRSTSTKISRALGAPITNGKTSHSFV